jgi:23S rRNA (uracil1939-C5)-methyltransferase
VKRFGQDLPRVTVNGFHFDVDPGAFFQSNRYLLGEFMQEVLEQAGPAPAHVLDLYCGSGFFSIPLAKRAREVLGVESNPVAVRQGRFNARLNEISNVKFFRGQVHLMLRDASIRPDVIVLNPPRAGCGVETAKLIARLRAARIVYVSCNPTTFAREAAAVLSENYRLEQMTLLDQFPNTHHIELIASFVRS